MEIGMVRDSRNTLIDESGRRWIIRRPMLKSKITEWRRTTGSYMKLGQSGTTTKNILNTREQ